MSRKKMNADFWLVPTRGRQHWSAPCGESILVTCGRINTLIYRIFQLLDHRHLHFPPRSKTSRTDRPPFCYSNERYHRIRHMLCQCLLWADVIISLKLTTIRIHFDHRWWLFWFIGVDCSFVRLMHSISSVECQVYLIDRAKLSGLIRTRGVRYFDKLLYWQLRVLVNVCWVHL